MGKGISRIHNVEAHLGISFDNIDRGGLGRVILQLGVRGVGGECK